MSVPKHSLPALRGVLLVAAFLTLVQVSVGALAAAAPSTVEAREFTEYSGDIIYSAINLDEQSTTTTTVFDPYPDGNIGSLSVIIDVTDPANWVHHVLPTAPKTPQGEWERGYNDSGAPHEYIEAFWRIGGIIDCESDFQSVSSKTGDHGYAQLNQIHRSWFVQLTTFEGHEYERVMLNPYWNGWMAGQLVKRKADRGSNPYGDWYPSGHCHGLA